jgi:hypothetical protein
LLRHVGSRCLIWLAALIPSGSTAISRRPYGSSCLVTIRGIRVIRKPHPRFAGRNFHQQRSVCRGRRTGRCNSFFEPIHQEIFTICKELIEAGQVATHITVRRPTATHSGARQPRRQLPRLPQVVSHLEARYSRALISSGRILLESAISTARPK